MFQVKFAPVAARVHGDVMQWVVPYSDEEIRIMSAEEIVRDCIPGNYIPTSKQVNEIAAEIVRALKLKWGVTA